MKMVYPTIKVQFSRDEIDIPIYSSFSSSSIKWINAILFIVQQNKRLELKKKKKRRKNENIADFAILIGRYVYPSCIVVISNYNSHKYYVRSAFNSFGCSTLYFFNIMKPKTKIVFWTFQPKTRSIYSINGIVLKIKVLYFCINKQSHCFPLIQ